MVVKYRKKPVEVEALQFTGHNIEDCLSFITNEVSLYGDKIYLTIHTLEGDHLASPGDYIIKGIQGEFYSCKPDIFEQTYERVSDAEEDL